MVHSIVWSSTRVIISEKMQKQKENLFLDKFSLLNSQEQPEDIIWSLSDSNEEPVANEKFNNTNSQSRILKRKRKKKVPKNISNLTITVLDTPKHKIDLDLKDTSPKHCIPELNLAPIEKYTISPVLPSETVRLKSPILTPRGNSLKNTGRVKKKLFSYLKYANELHNFHALSRVSVKTEIDSDYYIENYQITCKSFNPEPMHVKEERHARTELLNKDKSFFNSHFQSSQSTDCESISEIATQINDTKTSSEIEITSCKSQIQLTNYANTVLEQSETSLETSSHTLDNRKRRYRKNGLSFRLNNLLQRQNTLVSLWQNELYLAANSNFVIPKEQNTAFRIKKINFQYGCYLIEAVNVSGDEYFVLINSYYVSNTILPDTVIKIYEPFKVVQYKDVKMLFNVCKFECKHYIEQVNKNNNFRQS